MKCYGALEPQYFCPGALEPGIFLDWSPGALNPFGALKRKGFFHAGEKLEMSLVD